MNLRKNLQIPVLVITQLITINLKTSLIKHFFNLILLASVLLSCAAGKDTAIAKEDGLEQGNDKKDLPLQKRLEFENYFYQGLKDKMSGNNDRAEQNFQRALKVNPKSDVVLYELALLKLHEGATQEALEFITQAIQNNKENKWYYLMEARILDNSGEHSKAAKSYENIISLNPEEIDVYFSLANSYIKAGEPGQAIKALDKVEDQFGIMEEVVLQKQSLYLKNKKIDKAVAEIDKLIKLYPTNIKYLRYKADMYLEAEMPQKAYEVFEEMYRVDSTSSISQLALAEVYRSKGEQEKAMKMLKRVFGNPELDIDQKVRIIFNDYLSEGVTPSNKEEAFSLAAIMVETHPEEAKAHAVYGDLLNQDNQLIEAREQYRQALKLRKDVFAVWEQVLTINANLSDWESVADESEEALEYFPNQAFLYYMNGVANLNLKEWKTAAEILESGNSLIHNNPAFKSQLLMVLGETYHHMKNYRQSDKAFEDALEADPSNIVAMNNYAYYLSVRGEKLSKATDLVQAALKKDPENASYLDTYGWILYKQGEYAEAKKYIEKALQQSPGSAEVLEHYGDILYKLGQKNKALEQWNKAKKAGEGSDMLEKKITDGQLHE